MAEWSIALPWKGSNRVTGSGVRIPVSPPSNLDQINHSFIYKILEYCINIQYYVYMKNLHVQNQDPVLNQYISSNDKNAVKKTLAFEYFNNDMRELNQYIKNNLDEKPTISSIIHPRAQLEFTF